jgi:hypothetical protein
MSIDPIQLVLSNYNKLSILRKQLEDRTRELEEIEGTIRELLMYVKEVEYLKSISSAYGSLDANEQSAQLATLESRRSLLHELIKTLGELLTKTEQEAKSGKTSSEPSAPRSLEKNSMVGGSSPQPATTNKPTGDAGKKPLSFDEFRKKFPTSGV